MVLRSCKDFPLNNPNFIGITVALIVVFTVYLIEFFIREGKEWSIWWAATTSFLYAMSMWSFITVTVTDPGRVPVMWGLYNQDPNQRKFCLTCHNFKPERCHHCSKCKQCVLNMDHHCPWINNCVGFYNRKYFLLFIFYLLLALLLALIQMVSIQVDQISNIIEGSRSTDIHTVNRIITLIFCLVLFVTLSMFFHMHLNMVFENTTTLESMVRERRRRNADAQQSNFEDINPYDIGPWYNFTQVFGQNILYWFVPLQEEYFLKGKGVFWEKRTLNRDASRGSNIQTAQLYGNKSYGMYNF